MSFTFNETPESRDQQSGNAQSAAHRLIYKAVGEQDDYTVHAYALANTPLFVTRPSGVLFRRTISLRPDGFQQYFVEVDYGPSSATTNSFTFDFDTSGGTVNRKCAREHIHTYPTNGDFHKGAIGVKQDGTVEGADIVIPKLKFTFKFKFAGGIVTLAYVKDLAAITGHTNRYKWLAFNPGEILFMGASGSDGTQNEAELAYGFEAEVNRTDLTIGGISSISKKGHEYGWEEFEDGVDGGVGVTTAKRVHVERMYDDADLAAVFKWNIYTG